MSGRANSCRSHAPDSASGTPFGSRDPTASGGYTYLRNRWYDPATGRFLTQDPIGLAGGTNLYAYAGNDPVGFVDPFGLCAVGPPETIEVRVLVFCGGDATDEANYEYQTVVATRGADKRTLETIGKGASLLKGGSSDFTPESVSAEIQATVAAGAVYMYDSKTSDGGQAMSLAATVGQNLAFRTDVASHFAKGTNFLHRKIGGKYQTACQVLGHEGVHLVQHRSGKNDPRENEPVAEPIAWRCR